MSFAKNVCKNIGKNISKNVSGKYTQNFVILLNNLQQMRLKLLQREKFKKRKKKKIEATGDLICNKIADKITKISKN